MLVVGLDDPEVNAAPRDVINRPIMLLDASATNKASALATESSVIVWITPYYLGFQFINDLDTV
jgi:hypothetical protein